MTELVNQSDHERVYSWLKTMLIRHRFRPAEQLIIGDLADFLGVSATPVRESLVRLQAEHLLDATQRRGFFARMLSLKEMNELYELRFALMRHAVEMNLPHAGADTIAAVSREPHWRKHRDVATELDEPRSDADDQARRLETLYLQIVSLAENATMIDLTINTNERTHYVLSIDLEQAPRRFGAEIFVEEVSGWLREKNVAAVVESFERQLVASFTVMSEVIKEGINRAYALPGVKLSQSVPRQRRSRTGGAA
jgi:DNA-binding GntR family transcriptional regulator